jgi:DNA-binding GntR family transcriptional regulator
MAVPADDFIIEQPVSIRHKVYDYLRNEILSNRISAGTRLVEGQLAKKINVSRTPIREALHILEMENLVESFPRVGYRVKELRWEDVEELCEIRAVNEILSARWAMQRIIPAELEAMKKISIRLKLKYRPGIRNILWKGTPNFMRCWLKPAAARDYWSCVKCFDAICCGTGSKACMLLKQV